jgi:uncharacterized protein
LTDLRLTDDRDAVHRLLGREPQGAFEVVTRDAEGRPLVIRNAPRLDDGTPMPTLYWLVGQSEVQAVSRLEASGGVRRAEAHLDPAAVADAHRRYAAERDAALGPPDGSPVPHGGVGGTRQGIKCLHAHYAWHLAGGDDPVGRWVADRLADVNAVPTLEVTIEPDATTFDHDGQRVVIPVGPETLVAGELRDGDPPDAAALSNALGLLADHLDDAIREVPALLGVETVYALGAEAWHLVVVERGAPDLAAPAALDRTAVEEVFRLLATESRQQRSHNPGLDPARVDTVLGTCCIVLAIMRRLRLAQVLVTVASEAD